MNVDCQVGPVNASREAIWDALTNFDDMVANIRSMRNIEIHELPKGMTKSSELKGANDITGLKWSETRIMCSSDDEAAATRDDAKVATETMTVTKCVGKEYYETYNEMHDFSFTSRMYIKEQEAEDGDDGNKNSGLLYIGMTIDGVPLSICSKVMMFVIGWYMIKETRKALMSDLYDIQKLAEKKRTRTVNSSISN